jgi:hypothetical protein
MLSDLSRYELQVRARIIGFDLDAAEVTGLDDSNRGTGHRGDKGRKVRTPAAGRTAGTQRGSVNVTTFDTAAAWHKTKPLALALCACSLAFGLAGCETASSLFSSISPAPTAAVTNTTTGTATPTARPAQIAVAPVIGPPETVSKQLQAQLTADLERQNIRVAKSPGESAQYTLRGYVVSSLD